MSDVIISVENLGKKYRLNHQAEGQRYTALRDVLANKVKGLLANRKSESENRKSVEDFWALKDVSFEVKRGDVVGIIGRNGAGKSTLLKVLSRITEPTEGRVHLKGRVASLLEVGTGFHPELTGRENVFLNGAILGMSRAEIRQKFDEIVAFAEVEKFLDTPVKRYSSGMYVRLAFAVAAHLEPEILIVDEVLAVGDVEFQKKCLGKMESVSRREGRTVLFVSHNMQAVGSLCSRVLMLKGGNIQLAGETKTVVASYLQGEHGSSFQFQASESDARANDIAKLLKVVVHDKGWIPRPSYSVKEKVGITMTYEIFKDDIAIVDNFNVFNGDGTHVFVSHNVQHPYYNKFRKKGIYQSTAWIPEDLLPEGVFTVSAASISIVPFQIHFHEEQVVCFQMLDPIDGTTARGQHTSVFPGVVRPLLQWETMEVKP